MRASATDTLRPQPPGGMGRGTALAVLAHVLMLIALAFGLHWRASEPEGLSAELWSAVPQVAAPRAEPAPPQPEPKPEPKPVEKRAEPEPVRPDPQIAIEKARKERLEKERRERDEREDREKAEREKLAKLEKEKAEKRKQEEQRKQEQQEKQLAKLREENIKRMQGMVGATGAPSSTGNAMRDAAPSAGYAGRIKARIKPNIVFGDDLPANPVAEVEVRAAPDGTIVGRRLIKSSGSREWDDAVLRAIDRTEVLPRDVDGRVPSPIVIAFRPRE